MQTTLIAIEIRFAVSDPRLMSTSFRPVVLAVDDDPQVLRGIRRDLSHAYSGRYRVVAAESGADGLRTLDTLRQRREEPALLIADQRMPEMSGIEFLAKSISRFPSARRVLLTAYADTEAAIAAINQVKLHHYLIKPWEPPEEQLYPVLDELLDDWQASYQPPYGGIQVVGHRFAPATHRLRDFLTRHQQPFRFVDVERDADAVADGIEPCMLPVLLLPDGKRMVRPSNTELVAELRLGTAATKPHYDLVIVGSGPSGLAAGVYSASEGLSTLLLDADVPGGQAGTTSRIENYLGFPGGVAGAELIKRAVAQARRFGADLLSPVAAVSLNRAGRAKLVTLSDGRIISAGTVLLATGLSYRKLDADGAALFEGAGIYYGATVSETVSCAGERVWVVGGANSAGQAAVHFAKHGARVTMLVRAESLACSMSRYLTDEIEDIPGIEVRTSTVLAAAEGTSRLERITTENLATGETTTEPAESVFTFIGAAPRTEWLGEMVQRDDRGFVLTGPDLGLGRTIPGWELSREPLLLETSVPGVFAVGDVRAHSVKRLTSGVGEGAMVVTLVQHYQVGS